MKAIYGEVGEIKELRSTQVCRIAIEVPAESYKAVVAMLHGQKVLLTVAPPIHAPYGVVEPERGGGGGRCRRGEEGRRAARRAVEVGGAPLQGGAFQRWLAKTFPRTSRGAMKDPRCEQPGGAREADHLLRMCGIGLARISTRISVPPTSTNSSAGPTPMNKADREYARDAVSLGCALCRRLGWGETPAQFHHPRTGVGAARKAPDADGIPLCWEHHQGPTGVHGMGRKAFEKKYGVTEGDLTAQTKREVAELRTMRV
jgi:hypothetical protein